MSQTKKEEIKQKSISLKSFHIDEFPLLLKDLEKELEILSQKTRTPEEEEEMQQGLADFDTIEKHWAGICDWKSKAKMYLSPEEFKIYEQTNKEIDDELAKRQIGQTRLSNEYYELLEKNQKHHDKIYDGFWETAVQHDVPFGRSFFTSNPTSPTAPGLFSFSEKRFSADKKPFPLAKSTPSTFSKELSLEDLAKLEKQDEELEHFSKPTTTFKR